MKKQKQNKNKPVVNFLEASVLKKQNKNKQHMFVEKNSEMKIRQKL